MPPTKNHARENNVRKVPGVPGTDAVSAPDTSVQRGSGGPDSSVTPLGERVQVRSAHQEGTDGKGEIKDQLTAIGRPILKPNEKQPDPVEFSPHKNPNVYALILQEDGNWKGYRNMAGKVVTARGPDPQNVLLLLLTHDGKTEDRLSV